MHKIMGWVTAAFAAVCLAVALPSGVLQAQPAPTPSALPSGCYTDSSGLPVCGPNYNPPGTIASASPPIKITSGIIGRLPNPYEVTWDLVWLCNGSDEHLKIEGNTSYPADIPLGAGVCLSSRSYTKFGDGRYLGLCGTCFITTTESGVQHARGRTTITMTTPAASPPTNPSFLGNAFDFDQSHAADSTGYFITGTNNDFNYNCTLYCPTSSYIFNYQAFPYYLFMTNNSGYNDAQINGGTGRTNVTGFWITSNNTGQGDMDSFHSACKTNGLLESSPQPTSTPNPTYTQYAGDNAACTNYTAIGDMLKPHNHLNSIQIQNNDDGFAGAWTGITMQPTRTVAQDSGTNCVATPTAANCWGEWWTAYTCESQGSVPLDSCWKIRGPVTIDIDDAQANRTFAALGHDTLIYYNSATGCRPGIGDECGYSRYTSLGNTFCGYISADTAFECTVGGTLAFKATASAFFIPTIASGNWLGTTTNGQVTPMPSPSPIVTATPCGASPGRSGSFPNYTFTIPNCGNPQVATTGATSTTAPNASYTANPCGTGAENCSSGALTVTCPSGGVNCLGTMTYTASVAALATSQFLKGCVSSSSTFTPMGATQANGGNANPFCGSSPPATAIMGLSNFGDSSAGGGTGFQSTSNGFFCIAAGSSFTGTSYVWESSTGATVVYSTFAVVLTPSGCTL